MELAQRVRIPVEQRVAWDALNDPFVLKNCLPSCKSFDRIDGNSFEITLTAKVGPVKATFKGELTLSDVEAPYYYTITGAGKGGVAGFAKGSAEVYLKPIEGSSATFMYYQVTVSVGGKLAQVGSRLVAGAAKKMANDFFRDFVVSLSGDPSMEVEIENLVLGAGGLKEAIMSGTI